MDGWRGKELLYFTVEWRLRLMSYARALLTPGGQTVAVALSEWCQI